MKNYLLAVLLLSPVAGSAAISTVDGKVAPTSGISSATVYGAFVQKTGDTMTGGLTVAGTTGLRVNGGGFDNTTISTMIVSAANSGSSVFSVAVASSNSAGVTNSGALTLLGSPSTLAFIRATQGTTIGGPVFTMYATSGTLANPAPWSGLYSAGSALGTYNMNVSTGFGAISAGRIQLQVDAGASGGTPGAATYIPTVLKFYTTDIGGALRVAQVINSSGAVEIGANAGTAGLFDGSTIKLHVQGSSMSVDGSIIGASSITTTGGLFGTTIKSTGDVFTSSGTTTPTVSCGSGSPTTITASVRHTKLGNVAHYSVVVTVTDKGTCADYIVVPMPFTATAACHLVGKEVSATGTAITGSQPNSQGVNMRITDYTGAVYIGNNGHVHNLSGSCIVN